MGRASGGERRRAWANVWYWDAWSTSQGCCDYALYLEERLVGRGFGESVDEIDIERGEPIMNPDDVDTSGVPRPFRRSNKEFGTRVLERKVAAREVEIGNDGGAGDQRLAAGQILINHTATGVTKRGERNVRAVDDHAIDARRQAALAIIDDQVRRDGLETPDPSMMRSASGFVPSIFGDPRGRGQGGLSGGMGFSAGRVRRGMFDS